MARIPNLLAATAFSVGMAALTPATAQELSSLESVVSVELLQGWRDLDGSHYAGLEITLAPGWKTYWRTPGDGGLPTRLSWSDSVNLADAKVHWPRPDVFRIAGLRSIGYADRVVLPIEITPQRDAAIDAHLDIVMGVCKDICIPVHLSLQETLSAEMVSGVDEIQAAFKTIPQEHTIDLSCNIIEVENGYLLDVAANLPPLQGQSETTVVELPGQPVWISEPYFARDDDWIISTVRMSSTAQDAQIDLGGLRMTVLTTTSAVELMGCR